MKHVPLLLLWLVGVAAVAGAGLFADPPLDPVAGLRWADAYPVDGVATIVLAITLEIAILAAVLRPHSFRRSWIRASAALLVACVFLFVSVAAVMDTPPYAQVYAQWAFGVVILAFFVAAWAVVARAAAWTAARKGPPVA